MFPSQLIDLQERLAASPSPVERDIALWLSRLPQACDEGAFRLHRYHRKIDVAHKLMQAYDERIDKATSSSTVSGEGYLGMALVFIQAARQESCITELSRANTLRWVNSAFNCLDHVTTQGAAAAMGATDAELQTLLRRASAS